MIDPFKSNSIKSYPGANRASIVRYEDEYLIPNDRDSKMTISHEGIIRIDERSFHEIILFSNDDILSEQHNMDIFFPNIIVMSTSMKGEDIALMGEELRLTRKWYR